MRKPLRHSAHVAALIGGSRGPNTVPVGVSLPRKPGANLPVAATAPLLKDFAAIPPSRCQFSGLTQTALPPPRESGELPSPHVCQWTKQCVSVAFAHTCTVFNLAAAS